MTDTETHASGEIDMARSGAKRIGGLLAAAAVLGGIGLASAQQQQPQPQPQAPQQPQPRGATSYAPVDIQEPFAAIMARMKAAKAAVEKAHTDLLAERYDLADRPAQGAAMSRGKPLQEGVRAKLPADTNWDQLAAMSPSDIRDRGLFPKG